MPLMRLSGLALLALMLAMPAMAQEADTDAAEEAPAETTAPVPGETRADAEPEYETRYVSPRGVPVYVEDDVASLRLMRLEEDQPVQVLEESPGWVKVLIDGREGWMETDDLTTEAPETPEMTPVAELPEQQVEQVMNPWWTLAGLIAGVALGAGGTWLWLDRRMRRRYGGMRVKL